MNSIFDRVRFIIFDELGVDQQDVTADARFVDDLGADSLDTVELVMRLEEEFNLEIADEDAEKIHRVRDAVEYIQSHLSPEYRDALVLELDREYLERKDEI